MKNVNLNNIYYLVFIIIFGIFISPKISNAQAILYQNENYINSTSTLSSNGNWGNFNLTFPENWTNNTSLPIYLSNLALKVPQGFGGSNNLFIRIDCEVIGGGGPFTRYSTQVNGPSLNIGTTNFTYHNFELNYTGSGNNCDPNGIWRIGFDGNFAGSAPYIYTLTDNNYKIAVGISQEDYLPPLSTATRFISLSPSNGTTTASTTVDFNAQIYYNGTEIPGSSIDTVCLQYQNLEYEINQTPFNANIFRYCEPILASGQSGINITKILDPGFYTATWFFSNEIDGPDNAVFLPQTVEFIVVNSVLSSIIDWNASSSNQILPEDCNFDITSLKSWICNIQNAVMLPFKLLLIPDQNNLNTKLLATKDLLENKVPSSIFFDFFNPLNEMLNATTSIQGTDLVINLGNDSFLNGSTTIFAWNDAKDFMDNTVGETNVLLYIEWIIVTILSMYLILKFI